MVGLGPGLTPSSDDMLAGLVLLSVLYKVNAGSARGPTRLISEVVSAEARGRTTLLSEEFLRQACSGNGNEPVVRLCSALLTRPSKTVQNETRHVLNIGATSGTDTTLGIALGARFCIGSPSGLAERDS